MTPEQIAAARERLRRRVRVAAETRGGYTPDLREALDRLVRFERMEARAQLAGMDYIGIGTTVEAQAELEKIITETEA